MLAGAAAQTPGLVVVAAAPGTTAAAAEPRPRRAAEVAAAGASIDSDGTHTLYAASVDSAGNAEAPVQSASFKIDATPPTIHAAATTPPNANGWYDANVTVHFTCSDALSGVASCPADQNLSSEGTAVSSTAHTATDAAGNTSVSSNVVSIRLDKTAPSVTVTGVTSGASYTLGTAPTAGCSTTDALSGVDTQASLQLSGGSATNRVGSFTATCSGARDKAGNGGSASATYTVSYTFGGFLAPVDNPPTVNTGKAGRTYPVKFQLPTGGGGFIGDLSAVKSITYQGTSCGAFGSGPTDPLETTTTGSSGLRYDSTANQYVYTWATPSTAGCYTLFLTLDSGQVFRAYFNLS
jgi:hypothetical protein